MFCTQCGANIQEGNRFCTKCGTRAPGPPPPVSAGAVVKPLAAAAAAPAEDPRSSAVAVTDALDSAAIAAPSSTPEVSAPAPSKPEPPPQPFRMFGVEFEDEHPAAAAPAVAPVAESAPAPAAVAAPVPARNDEFGFPGGAPVGKSSRGLGAGFWFAAFVIVVLGMVGFFGWTMLSSRPSGISVRVDPPTVQVRSGGTVTLSATVAGDPDASVTWSLMEGAGSGFVRSTGVTAAGGKVTAAAEYLAPLKAGTYHVLATSTKDTKQASSAEIVVAP